MCVQRDPKVAPPTPGCQLLYRVLGTIGFKALTLNLASGAALRQRVEAKRSLWTLTT